MDFVETGESYDPPRLLVYALPGFGKTTFAASAPAPLVLQTEEGAAQIGADRTPLAESFDQVMDWLAQLYKSEQPKFKTIVIDSLDHLEPLIHKKVCEDQKVKSIEDISYGKGYIHALDYWRRVARGLDPLRKKHSMGVIMIAHHQVKAFHDPVAEDYDRYEM